MEQYLWAILALSLANILACINNMGKGEVIRTHVHFALDLVSWTILGGFTLYMVTNWF